MEVRHLRIHISIDLEGVAGVADAQDALPGAPHFAASCELMTAEANAAIEGCFDAGATEVIVNDSHDGMLNLVRGQLDRRARVIRGFSKPLGMMQGLDEQTAATMFLGYHARAGNPEGVLNHTMRSGYVQGIFLNGEPAGELRLNAALAGCLGVPVALISGDDVLCAEGRDCLGDVEAVQVKEAIDKYVALSVHPLAAQDLIRDAARRAVTGMDRFTPYRVREPATLRVAWNSTSLAALSESVPGVNRTAPYEVEYTGADYPQVYRLLRVLLLLAEAQAGPWTYD